MPRKKEEPLIVYHGTWTGKKPHLVADGSFHAGTRKSALDRITHTVPRNPKQAEIHKYEVDPSVVSMMTYTDPQFDPSWVSPTASPSVNASSSELRVNAGSVGTRAKKYINLIEDKGSTSYQIPNHLVNSGMVKHLGVQFEGYNPDTDDPNSDVRRVEGDPDFWEYK